MLKHNKKKNSQIIYEQLMTLATRLALSGNVKESKIILTIVKEHFAPSTELGREKKLFDSLLEYKNSKQEKVESVLSEVLNEVKLIREKVLEREKIILINKVIDKIGKDLFSIPIKEYKLLASIQILFNETRNNFKHSKPVERVKIKSVLVENMMKPKQAKDDYEEIDNLTYQIMVKKFNDKYSSVLNENQKQILTGYIDFLLTEDGTDFIPMLEEKRDEARAVIQLSLTKEKHENSEYKELLEESVDQLRKGFNKIDEDVIYETMRYFDLIEDLEEVSREE